MKGIRANPNRNIDKSAKIQPTTKRKLKFLINSISTNKFFLSLNLGENKLNNIIINALNIIDVHIRIYIHIQIYIGIGIDIVSIIFQYIF